MKPSLRQRFNISRLAVQYGRLTVVCWLAVAVAGLLAFSSLKYALFPDISFPIVAVTARVNLETVLATENQVTDQLEAGLQSLDPLPGIYSTTYPGQSVVNVMFEAGANLESATERVKTALAKVSLPPKTAVEVLPIDLNESASISYAMTSDRQNLRELGAIAQAKILPALNQLPTVRKVNLLGDGGELENAPPTRVSFNGREALALQVIKRGDANTLEAVSQVEKVVRQWQAQLPQLQLRLAETQADYIREAVGATIEELVLAVILAVAVVFPFLRNWRATLITALAIPLSLLGTCLVLAAWGLTLQTITLLALALVIGIVIDDAIVDVENIARLVEEGKQPKEAAIEGTDEIGLAVTASTLTIAAVFIPVAFMGGTVGKFFQPFGLTVSAAVLFSLLVARTLSPVLAASWLKPRGKKREMGKQGKITNLYRKLLKWSLNHRRIVVGIALLSFAAGMALIPMIPKGFIPELDRGTFHVAYTVPLPKSLNLDNSQNNQLLNPKSDGFDWIEEIARSPERLLLRKGIRVGRQLEEAVLTLPDVDSVFTVAGLRGDPTKGKLFVQLKEQRQHTTAEVEEQVRRVLPQLKGVTASVEDIPFVQTEAEKPLQIAIQSDNLEILRQTAEAIQTKAKNLPGLAEINLSSGREAINIERLNGQYAIYLSANLEAGRGLEDAAQEIEDLAQPLLPAGVTLQRWGNSAHSSDVLGSFGATLTLSVILMLLVLILLFRRLLEPLVVGLSLPLSLVGAMLGLLVTGSDFGIISLIGLIFLVGLLNKNALLLMDYANQLRKWGFSREEALIETGAVRLRPIFMTTASTILGMVPIAVGWGAGAELRQPMAMAIIGGLTTSFLLSLIVVPVLYTLLEDGWLKIAGQGKS